MKIFSFRTKLTEDRLLRRCRTATALVFAGVLLAGCSAGGGEDDGGGIIGTGIQIRGTVPTNRAFAEATIEIRANSGELSTAAIASNGTFTANGVQGDAPYLLRVNLGNDIFLYGISSSVDAASITQNVHAYSDIASRNLFAQNGLDIDSVFESTGPLTLTPSPADIAAADANVTALIAPALSSYGLANVNLQDVDFVADNTGVDLFLDQNPVIVNNGNITIVITDPDNSTASTVADNLPINTDLSAADNIAPLAPTGVRALASASNEIVVAWESASDNIAVVSYNVLRDGVVIEETPFPVFIDTGLQSGVVFEYEIVAIDAAGNESPLSVAASSTTLAAPDITAPPSPTNVQLNAGTASVAVTWTQSDIADVASFTLLRSEAGSMLDTLVRVTSTAFDDVGLNSGTEYCYQVIASDASENDSPASDLVCTVTSGSSFTGVPTPVGTPVTPTTPTPGTSPAASLLAVDVSNIACTQELTNNDVDGTVTLPAGCYMVDNGLSLGDDDFLTLSPGTVLKFASSDSLTIASGGSLTALGTEANPIVFTGQQPTDGFWAGLSFNFSNNLNNQLQNVIIEFAGSGSSASTAALRLGANGSFASRLSANSVLLRNSTSAGFRIENGSILDAFEDVISTENEFAGEIIPTLAASIGATGQLTGSQMTAGFWDGIEYSFTNSVLNVLDNVVISDAGSGGVPASSGSIELRCNGTFPGQVNLSNTTVSNGISFGVFTSNTGRSVNVGANVDLTDNAQGAFNPIP